MSGKFEPITLTWKGRNYIVQPKQILGAIMRIEDTVTLTEMYSYFQRGGAPIAKLAKAYADVLVYAGVPKADDLEMEVYTSMFDEGSDRQKQASEAVIAILGMMVPPEHMQQQGKRQPAGNSARKVGRSSSRKRTKI